MVQPVSGLYEAIAIRPTALPSCSCLCPCLQVLFSASAQLHNRTIYDSGSHLLSLACTCEVSLRLTGPESGRRSRAGRQHSVGRCQRRLAAASLVTSIGASMSSAAAAAAAAGCPWDSVYDLDEGSSRLHALWASSSFDCVGQARELITALVSDLFGCNCGLCTCTTWT